MHGIDVRRRCATASGAIALVAIVLLLIASSATAFSTPPRTGWVTDAAGILDQQSISALATRLEELQRKTGDEVIVVTLPSLEGVSIETWGNVLGDGWKVGKSSGRDTGVLLIVAPNDREVRIAVGYGLGNRISDSIAASIISEHILPLFRNGRMADGIRAGIESIALQLDTAAASTSLEQSPYSVPRPSLWFRLRSLLTPSQHTLIIIFCVLVVVVVLFAMYRNASYVGRDGVRRRGWNDDDDDYYPYGSRWGSSWSNRGASWGGSGGGSSFGSSSGGGGFHSSGSSWGGGGGSHGGSFGGGASGKW